MNTGHGRLFYDVTGIQEDTARAQAVSQKQSSRAASTGDVSNVIIYDGGENVNGEASKTKIEAAGGILDQYAASAQAQTTDPVGPDSNIERESVQTGDAPANGLPDIRAAYSIADGETNVKGRPARALSARLVRIRRADGAKFLD